MISKLLARLEEAPSTVFYERELRDLDEAEFDRLRRAGFLEQADSLAAGNHFDYEVGCRFLTVVEGPSGILEALDENDSTFPALPLYSDDVRQWRLDLGGLAGEFQSVNGWTGTPSWLAKNLYFLGEADRTAFVLGLIGSCDPVSSLTCLPALIPSLDHFVVISSCPVTPLDNERLAVLRIEVIALADGSPFYVRSSENISDSKTEDQHQFAHSDDYRSIFLRDRSYTLSERQAAVVGILHRARRAGTPDLHWDAIKRQLEGAGFYVDRMQDVFKSLSKWSPLIHSPKRAFFRLNL